MSRLKLALLLLPSLALVLIALSARQLKALVFMPDRQVAQRLVFPVADSPFPVAAGDTVADHVLGQMDLAHGTINFADASTLHLARTLAGVAIDRSSVPNHVYVADAANSRVLGWSSAAALSNGKAADLVIGQPDFFTTTCNSGGIGAASLCDPGGIAVDNSGNLYVADTRNSRVLEYNTPYAHTAVPGSGDNIADQVFGQEGNFTTGQCNQGVQNLTNSASLCRPVGVTIDNTGVLYIADSANNRVLEYLFPSIDVIPNDVFGQGGHFNTAACNKGARNADSLCGPAGMAVDSSNNLYVADQGNSRVLEYNNPIAEDTTADRIFGQSGNFTIGSCNEGAATPNFFTLCGPVGVALDSGGVLYVADRNNSRVLVFPTPLSNSVPSTVIGQTTLTTNTCNINGVPDAHGLCSPTGVAADAAGNLYVSDVSNNRVLKYNTPLASDTIADVVLGQPDFAHNDRNAVDASTFAGSGGDVILAGTLDISALGTVAIDNSVSPARIWVADTHNNRVLGFNNISALTNGEPASIVIGQSSFTTGFSKACRGAPTASNLCSPTAVAVDAAGDLFVADELDNRVLKYAAPVTTGKAATLVIGQPDFASNQCNGGGALTAAVLCSPWSLALDAAGNLYVADLTNNRVLEYTKPVSSHPNAARVFGQSSFTSGGCNKGGNPSAATLCEPTGVKLDSSGRLYIADYSNGRVLRYNTPLTSQVANLVWGQGPAGNDFVDNNCNGGGIGAATLCNPADAAADSLGNVYIADAGNNRILHYSSGSFTANLVFGQAGFFSTNGANLGGSGPSAATLSLPLWLALDNSGNLYASDAQNNRVLQYLAPLGGPSPTPTPGNANLSTSGLAFGSVARGSVSKAKTVTLTNTGAGAITINAVTRAGSNPADFPFNSGCFGTLGGGKSCTISIMFAPSAPVTTPEAAQFQIYDTAKNSPQLLAVYGTSTAQVSVTPSALSFGNQLHGTTSASKTVTITNNQNATVSIGSIALGGTNPGDFLKTTTCGASLAPFANCGVSVSFKPATTGARSAVLTVTDSPDSLSPHNVNLSGTGT